MNNAAPITTRRNNVPSILLNINAERFMVFRLAAISACATFIPSKNLKLNVQNKLPFKNLKSYPE